MPCGEHPAIIGIAMDLLQGRISGDKPGCRGCDAEDLSSMIWRGELEARCSRSGDLDSLPSWTSDHLGEGSSFMTGEVNQSPMSPVEGSPVLETDPLAAIHPSVEEKTNIMTLEELNSLRETYYFPFGVRGKASDEGETIISARPSEVAFYKVAFPAGLRFSIHPTIRLILQFYNICPAQLVPNAWRSIACSMAMWRAGYFKARYKKTLLGGYPNNVKGWKSKFFFVSGDEWERPEGSSREGAPRVPRTWGVPGEGHPGGEVLSSLGDAAMSRRISFKKLGKKLEKSKNGSSLRIPTPAKGVVIGEKRAGESLANLPSKKGKVNDGSKGKGLIVSPKARRSPSVVEKLLRGMIPPTDKEKMDKLTLDQTATKLFHVIGQALVLRSSLAIRSREAGEHASLQQRRAASMETEVARLQKLSADLEQQLVEVRVCEQQENDELAKTKSDQDSFVDKFERSGVQIVELREALDKAKESIVEEFKSSSEFVVAVKNSASKYFGGVNWQSSNLIVIKMPCRFAMNGRPILATFIMAIKTSYHFATNGRSILAMSAMGFLPPEGLDWRPQCLGWLGIPEVDPTEWVCHIPSKSDQGSVKRVQLVQSNFHLFERRAFQALDFLLVNIEEVGAFFYRFLQLIKLATNSRLRSPKESMVPGYSFQNHDLAAPFKVAENALHITSSEQPWSDIRLLVSTVIGAPVPALMASSLVSRYRIFCEDPFTLGRGWTRRLTSLSPFLTGTVILGNDLPSDESDEIARPREREEQLEAVDWPWPSRFGTWLVFAIGWTLLSRGLLALGLDLKRMPCGEQPAIRVIVMDLLQGGISGDKPGCRGCDVEDPSSMIWRGMDSLHSLALTILMETMDILSLTLVIVLDCVVEIEERRGGDSGGLVIKEER
ncbi:hypothetical protein Acr_00g0016890 [Actinidia rufa]|uniref:Uncharacterized protein n=1 Tax=Actinidia rufa TaxID=165716 RepID=A0A7J0DB06_9ERIC|nr:hypothetical protein Acr_00g0016890 [Actinidia rufa]